MIGTPFDSMADRIARTREELAAGASLLYEAAFTADGVHVLLDILERSQGGFRLIEVKQSTSVKATHVADAAVQVYVARKAGLDVRTVELMHLNRECRYPDLSNLFVREDITADVEALLPELAAGIPALPRVVAGPLPDVAIGDHCRKPDPCPFLDRCWPPLPPYHVSTLYSLRQKMRARLEELECATIDRIPADFELGDVRGRQRQAVVESRLVIEPALTTALAAIREPLAFLDFETLSRAVPVWPGCRPWEQVPAQLSCHVRSADGTMVHHEWLAQGPADPRRQIAEALIEACRGAAVVLAYNASFERTCIEGLAEALPDLAEPLLAINARLVDLLPIVRKHVYHPEFDGSFSLKAVAPALLPEISYEDLEIASGGEATLGLARLLLTTDLLSDEERAVLRSQLLAYCDRDTWCLVGLLDRLREVAGLS
jgi:predicted RecB family nuclease